MSLAQLLRSKTVWSGLSLIASGVAGYAVGDVTAVTAITTAIQGVIAIFLRTAIAKAGQ